MKILKITPDKICFDNGTSLQMLRVNCKRCYVRQTKRCYLRSNQKGLDISPDIDLRRIDTRAMGYEFHGNLHLVFCHGLGFFLGDESSSFLIPVEQDVLKCISFIYKAADLPVVKRPLRIIATAGFGNYPLKLKVGDRDFEITNTYIFNAFVHHLEQYRNKLHSQILYPKRGYFKGLNDSYTKVVHTIKHMVSCGKPIDYDKLSEKAKTAAELKKTLAIARLEYKKNKILFNSINNLYNTLLKDDMESSRRCHRDKGNVTELERLMQYLETNGIDFRYEPMEEKVTYAPGYDTAVVITNSEKGNLEYKYFVRIGSECGNISVRDITAEEMMHKIIRCEQIAKRHNLYIADAIIQTLHSP